MEHVVQLRNQLCECIKKESELFVCCVVTWSLKPQLLFH